MEDMITQWRRDERLQWSFFEMQKLSAWVLEGNLSSAGWVKFNLNFVGAPIDFGS